MANNRLWLIHRPSMIGVMLGKHLGGGWYAPPTYEKMGAFYDFIENYDTGSQKYTQEDLELWHEDLDGWGYGDPMDNGLRKFVR